MWPLHPRSSSSSNASVFLLFLVALVSSCTALKPIRGASALNGAVDLSTGVNFQDGDMVRLDGDWSFYQGELKDPGSLDVAAQTRRVPSLWASVNGFHRAVAPVTGVGTLHLRVTVPPVPTLWALRVPNANSALRLFVNGSLVAQIGQVSEDPAVYSPSNELAIPEFFADSGVLDIVMQVANYSTPYIGTWDSPILGTSEVVLRKRKSDIVYTALISGALLIMGLYHLGLFFQRKNDKTSLLFGLICLHMTVRNLMMGERLLLDLFPPGASSWAWAFKIEHLSAHMVVPLFGLFFLKLFPRQIKALPVRIILVGASLWAALILLTPPMIYQRFLHWYEYFLLAGGVYVLVAIIVAALCREEGALLVLTGLVVLLGTAANDVLLSVGILSSTMYLASFGVFLYTFTQGVHLSMIFSKAFTEVETLSNDLLAKNRELESLHTIDLAIASSMELNRVLTVILEQALQRLTMDAADVLLLDEDGTTLVLGARVGFHTNALVHTRLGPGQGYAGKALQSGTPIVVRDLSSHTESFGRSPFFSSEGFCFYAGSPLTVKGVAKGVLELYRREPFEPDGSWGLYFSALSSQAAVALDNSYLVQGLRRANEELKDANEATIEGWAVALELRDRETEGHSRRVTEMTVALAKRFGIHGIDLERVRHGALLHDIGKMGIPDSILLKTGPLSDEELQIMRRHPAIAKDFLSKLRFLNRSLDIPYSHHEKWDGTGYPQGLSGADIPLPARLFAVVDVWDALSSDRPYRSAWPEDRVREHLISLSGSHFDPEAVEAFTSLLAERRGAGSGS